MLRWECPFNPRRTYWFSTYAPAEGGGGRVRPPLAVSPLVELARRGKNERVRRYETQRLVPDFKVLGQPVTSEVRSSAPRYGSVFGE